LRIISSPLSISIPQLHPQVNVRFCIIESVILLNHIPSCWVPENVNSLSSIFNPLIFWRNIHHALLLSITLFDPVNHARESKYTPSPLFVNVLFSRVRFSLNAKRPTLAFVELLFSTVIFPVPPR
jgi:hypothetical protein